MGAAAPPGDGRPFHPSTLETADLFADGCDCRGQVRESGAVFVEDGLQQRLARLAKRRGVAGGREEESGQLLGGVEAAAQVVVLACGAAEEGVEVTELHSLDGPPVRCGEKRGLPRTDADDLDRVALPELRERLDRVEQHVPDREAEVADDEVFLASHVPGLAERGNAGEQARRDAWELLAEELLNAGEDRVELGRAAVRAQEGLTVC